MEAALGKRAADLLTACVRLRAVVRACRERGLPEGPLAREIDALVAEVDRVLDRSRDPASVEGPAVPCGNSRQRRRD